MVAIVLNEVIKRWLIECWHRAEAEPSDLDDKTASGDYSNFPWDEWKRSREYWQACQSDDFSDPDEFCDEVLRQARASHLAVHVRWNGGPFVYFRFDDFPETAPGDHSDSSHVAHRPAE